MSNSTDADKAKPGTSGLFLSHLDPLQTKQETPTGTYSGPMGERPLTSREIEEMNAIERQWPEATHREIEFRHSGWKPNRDRVKRALLAVDVADARRHRFDHCGSGCVFVENIDTGEIRLRANYCGDRFCVPCANLRSRDIQSKVEQLMQGGRHSMITLTLAHSVASCEATIDTLLGSFAKLRERMFWKRAVKGGAYFVELTRGAHGTAWHIHLHVLAKCSFIKWEELRDAWREITKTSHVVHVRAVDDNRKGAIYSSKYATKGFDQSVVEDHQALVEAITALSGRRLVGTFGTWWKVKLVDTKGIIGRERVLASLDSMFNAAEAGDGNAALVIRRWMKQAELNLFNPSLGNSS